MISIPFKINNSKFQYLAAVSIMLILLVIGKDLMHSYVNNYSYYITESLLFGSFWIMFIPLALFCKKTSKKKSNIFLPMVFSLFHLGIFSLFVFLISILFFNNTFEIHQTFMQTTSEYGLVCLFVYSFFSSHLLRNQTALKALEHQNTSDRIKVTHQNRIIVLECKDILYVKSEKPYIAIITKERTYLHNSSLKNILKERSTNFIQIHKSIIVNTDYIVSYTSRKNGDYDIQLKNKEVVRASRNFNKNFKSFFDSISLK